MDTSNNTIEKRKWKQLTEQNRYHIEALYKIGYTAKQIAAELIPPCDRRTVERELKRGMTTLLNSDLTEKRVYLADVGQRKREESDGNRGRPLKIGNDHTLAQHIETMILEYKYSPDAVIGRIKEKGLHFATSICTKTLYNYIDKGIFAKISNKDLWVKCHMNKRSYQKIRTVSLNNVKGKSITERPEEVNQREEQGHWEIDFVVGKQGTKPAILTLVERKSRKSCYLLTKNKTQFEVLRALRKLARKMKGDFSEVFKTITADNGSEFLDGEGMKKAIHCGEIYYAHPYSSWERGSNENGNRMLRRFIPKGTDITKITAKALKRIEDWVNNYPRKILGYRTANEVYVA